jgi:hypothetical protein
VAGKRCTEKLENHLDIELFGKQHKFKTNLEIKIANEVVGLLTKEVYSVQGQFVDGLSEENQIAVLILSALNLAKKNIELINSNSDLKLAIEKRSKKIIDILDNCLQKENNDRLEYENDSLI